MLGKTMCRSDDLPAFRRRVRRDGIGVKRLCGIEIRGRLAILSRPITLGIPIPLDPYREIERRTGFRVPDLFRRMHADGVCTYGPWYDAARPAPPIRRRCSDLLPLGWRAHYGFVSSDD